jgi:type I restriction enzyme S subunit
VKAGWTTKPLSEVCTFKPQKSEARAKLASEDEVSFVPMENLGIGSKELTLTGTRSLAEVAGSYTYFAEGDVLLAKITPCFENGKLGIARNLVNGIGFGSSEYIVIRPSPEVDADFLYHFLDRETFREEGAKQMTGAVGHKRVPKEYVEGALIPVPTIEEQRRIITLLDEAFADIATAKANAEKNLQNTRALYRSVASELFSANATDWPNRTLDQLATNLDSKRIPITKSDRCSGEYPYYGASGIVDHVDGYIFDGDHLLISEDGANLLARSTPIAFPASGKYWVNNHAHILKFDDMATQKFVELYLESIPLDDYITGAAQPKLNQKSLNSIPIRIPDSTAEQRIIVDRLIAIQEQCDQLAAIHEQKLTALDDLKKSLLHQAFSGQL